MSDEPTLPDVLLSMARSFQSELLALSEDELRAKWCFRWEADAAVDWNLYQFSDRLESYKRQCREWETHHHGSTCVVERVRDKYLMPQIRAFMVEMIQRAAPRAGL